MTKLSEISGHGTYALVLSLAQARRVRIGQLGKFRFKPGKYLYIGSAFGPGGLAARLAHHCRIAANPRWHVDYLRTVAVPRRAWYTRDPLQREHQWADIIAKMTSVEIPAAGFGASDCRCRSHLCRFDKLPPFKDFIKCVYDAMPGHKPILEYDLKDQTIP